MLALDQSFFYYPSIFTAVDWIMLMGMTLSVIGAQTTKLYSFQSQTASKLQVLGNLGMVNNFIFDFFLFHPAFSDL